MYNKSINDTEIDAKIYKLIKWLSKVYKLWTR